ncbi:MAG: RHS repeat protein [Acidobacteria bacterium]|nr:RHS repeat protein [Acidobacteriota bacterium]
MSYTAFLGLASVTEPNSSTGTVSYDAAARPSSVTSPHGAVTTYAYTNSPPTVTATTSGRWTKTTMDGFGRPVKVEQGDSSGVKSIVDTEYAACACAPLGKVWRVSQPYAPGGTLYWTTNSYDCLGRTTTVALPNGSGSTTYLYQGNTTRVTDPAGKWKTFTTNAMGNLVQVTEPNPAGGNHETYYTYNLPGKLTQVSMTRGSFTQIRTFVYDSELRLTSATNPENGTVTYVYNADHTLQKRTDARNQRLEYTYDQNPVDPAYSQNAWGRRTTAEAGNVPSVPVPAGLICWDG